MVPDVPDLSAVRHELAHEEQVTDDREGKQHDLDDLKDASRAAVAVRHALFSRRGYSPGAVESDGAAVGGNGVPPRVRARSAGLLRPRSAEQEVEVDRDPA